MYNNVIDYHLTGAERGIVPTHFYRFEDLIADPYNTLKKIFEFVFGVETIEGTYLEKRLKRVIENGAAKTRTYRPRTGTQGVNKNL